MREVIVHILKAVKLLTWKDLAGVWTVSTVWGEHAIVIFHLTIFLYLNGRIIFLRLWEILGANDSLRIRYGLFITQVSNVTCFHTLYYRVLRLLHTQVVATAVRKNKRMGSKLLCCLFFMSSTTPSLLLLSLC
jgi:hypothetical protein